jgi:Lon protease-like protein
MASTTPHPGDISTGAQITELPIFPLNTVLFPGGVIHLRLFEPRYLRMAADCLKAESPFGVCLIAEGREAGTPAVPHAIGVKAHIRDWDMEQLGLLHVSAVGGERFRILTRQADGSGLIRAQVERILPELRLPLPEGLADLAQALRAIVDKAGPDIVPRPHDFHDASWVGCRLCELLPLPLPAKQGLLELDEPLVRLGILKQYLQQRGML